MMRQKQDWIIFKEKYCHDKNLKILNCTFPVPVSHWIFMILFLKCMDKIHLAFNGVQKHSAQVTNYLNVKRIIITLCIASIFYAYTNRFGIRVTRASMLSVALVS